MAAAAAASAAAVGAFGVRGGVGGCAEGALGVLAPNNAAESMPEGLGFGGEAILSSLLESEIEKFKNYLGCCEAATTL